MSHLASPVKSISELRIHPLPAGKAINVTKAIRYDGKTFILGAEGTVYSSCVRDNGFYTLSMWGFATSMVRALARIGVITRKDAETHLAAARATDEWRHKRERVADFAASARKIGMKLTRKQLRQLEKMKK